MPMCGPPLHLPRLSGEIIRGGALFTDCYFTLLTISIIIDNNIINRFNIYASCITFLVCVQ